MNAFIVFPNHLLKSPEPADRYILVEHPHFFTDYRYHKKKLLFHRAGLKYYQGYLKSLDRHVFYLDLDQLIAQGGLGKYLKAKGIDAVTLYDPVNHSLKSALQKEFKAVGVKATWLDSPLFLCGQRELKTYFPDRRRYSMGRFYTAERKRLDILLKDDKPEGGKWSLDTENRKKLPQGMAVPEIFRPAENPHVREAARYVNKRFGDNPGTTDGFFYPVTHADAEKWLEDFLCRRLDQFGPYEDAIAKDEPFLFHSLLSCVLNVGLVTVRQVLDAVLDYGRRKKIRLNSLEGFVRQIIGWREFIRGVYVIKGRELMKSNYWKSRRDLPSAFYSGTTGIEPLDSVVGRVVQNAYVHHIERLMVLGNFMLLCEIHPQQVYRWYMELFIDAYEWVMVPNVLGMSQYAAGRLMTTKPYISSSNYIRKMSDFQSGPWCRTWDGLYWRFIHSHKDAFLKIGRMNVMAQKAESMEAKKLRSHLQAADSFLKDV